LSRVLRAVRVLVRLADHLGHAVPDTADEEGGDVQALPDFQVVTQDDRDLRIEPHRLVRRFRLVRCIHADDRTPSAGGASCTIFALLTADALARSVPAGAPLKPNDLKTGLHGHQVQFTGPAVADGRGPHPHPLPIQRDDLSGDAPALEPAGLRQQTPPRR
jgi:hypothetical protein